MRGCILVGQFDASGLVHAMAASLAAVLVVFLRITKCSMFDTPRTSALEAACAPRSGDGLDGTEWWDSRKVGNGRRRDGPGENRR